MDTGRKETDAKLEELEKRIAKEYKIAEKEVKEKLDDYLRRFEKKDEKWQEWVQDGKKTKEQYNQWRTGQIAIGRRWEETRETIAEDYHNANIIAKAIIDNQMLDVYAMNHNYATYEVEHESKLDTSYTLYNRDTVRRIMDDGYTLYHAPGKKLAEEIAANKDIRWNKQQIQSIMMQSILQGESIPKMATRLADTVGESNRAVAIRNARTMTTGVENAARLDGYRRAESMGIKTKKMWVAVMDERTRISHREVDGEVVELDELFSNGCAFPGDPDADPAEIYNCRCGMNSVIEGYENDITNLDLRYTEHLEEETYDEWKHAHESVSNPITLQEEKGEAIRQSYLAEYRGYVKSVDNSDDDDTIGTEGRYSAETTDESIFNNDKYNMPEAKITLFLLAPGSKHSKEFFDVGYKENDADRLNDDIYSQYDESKMEDITETQDGVTKFSIFMKLGITKKRTFRTVWQKDTEDSKPRFITGYREDE